LHSISFILLYNNQRKKCSAINNIVHSKSWVPLFSDFSLAEVLMDLQKHAVVVVANIVVDHRHFALNLIEAHMAIVVADSCTVEDNRPVVAVEDNRLVVAVEDNRPVVAVEDNRPVVAVEDSRPVVAVEDSRPVVAVEDSKPVVAVEDNRIVVDSKLAEDIMH
jgi:hypothetical protein